MPILATLLLLIVSLPMIVLMLVFGLIMWMVWLVLMTCRFLVLRFQWMIDR